MTTTVKTIRVKQYQIGLSHDVNRLGEVTDVHYYLDGKEVDLFTLVAVYDEDWDALGDTLEELGLLF